MNIKNCSNCGNIYIYDGFNICLKCRKAEEEDFQRVKDYIYKNPRADISKVSEETKVESKKIIEFLKQGRLEIKDEDNVILACERCEKPIKTGRFCKKCTVEMQKAFKMSLAGGEESKDLQDSSFKEKIRITERRKRR